MAMAARMPMMIMTTRSSMRVKPSSRSSMALRMRDSIVVPFQGMLSTAFRGVTDRCGFGVMRTSSDHPIERMGVGGATQTTRKGPAAAPRAPSPGVGLSAGRGPVARDTVAGSVAVVAEVLAGLGGPVDLVGDGSGLSRGHTRRVGQRDAEAGGVGRRAVVRQVGLRARVLVVVGVVGLQRR